MPHLGSIAKKPLHDPGRITLLQVQVAAGARAFTVSGVVYDAAGLPCARVVRVHRRGDGYLLAQTTSNPITGAYSLACTEAEVYRVVLDDEAGVLLNDLIDRVLPG